MISKGSLLSNFGKQGLDNGAIYCAGISVENSEALITILWEVPDWMMY